MRCVPHPSFAFPVYCRNNRVLMLGLLRVRQSHRRLQKAVREFIDTIVFPDAQMHELDGKRPSQGVLDKMA